MMRILCLFFGVSVFYCRTSADNTAIQIISPVNHSFHLELDQLKQVLERDEIKDRNVVVVSIAGAYRQGKSFLLNFFLKYLYAQYKKHDVSDWIGEQSNASLLDGFKWRSGRERETTGIWMWSDVFTHDYENGEKVAILLLDTQGIFDSRSTVQDCTTIFALSMMLSSIQCYNLMQNIKEDDLQHLELFTEYGRLALEQTQEKPFQHLLFTVRDWPFAGETNYGWHGQKIIDEIFAGNSEQTAEMLQLRKRIDSSFQKISAFLMPHPGFAVAHGDFNGDIQQISAEFKKYVNELVPTLLAPEKLLVKEINGQKIRARDFADYLKTYVNIFNSDKLPEPKTVLMATAEASSMILYNDCMRSYTETVGKCLSNDDSYISDSELQTIHENAKNEAVEQFKKTPKLGGDELASTFRMKLENDAVQRFASFKQENERKRAALMERAKLHNEKLSNLLKTKVKSRMTQEIEASNAIFELKMAHWTNIFAAEKQVAFVEFDNNKMGDAELSNLYREKLKQDLDNMQAVLVALLDSSKKSSQQYVDSMQNRINEQEYLNLDEFMKIHREMKGEAIKQFQAYPGDDEFKFMLQPKIDKNIEEKFTTFGNANERKRQASKATYMAHTETIANEIRASFENRMRSSIGKSYLSGDTFANLFVNSKQEALQEFEMKKVGNDELANEAYRDYYQKLSRELDALQGTLKQMNEANKPPPPKKDRSKLGINLIYGVGKLILKKYGVDIP